MRSYFVIVFGVMWNSLLAQWECGNRYLAVKPAPLEAVHYQKTLSGKIIIPVVFHVIHNNGPEKISVLQCEAAVEALNRDFRRQYGTRGAGMGVDTEIEFSLATLDPYGYPTTGVTYTTSSLTNHHMNNDPLLKQLIIWDTQRYLNIWTVKEIGGGSGGTVLGYAYYPGAAPNLDGVVVRADCIGSRELYPQGLYFGDNIYGRTLTHEVGHYLNLPHTFEGGCYGGDGIDDTPPADAPNYGYSYIKRINSCNNDPVLDVPDQVRNYMDYAGDAVADIFTQGQKDQMIAALHAYRSTLISPSNQQLTGTGRYQKPKASFWVSTELTCPGGDIFLLDYSRNDPSSWQWTVFNDSFSISFSQQSPNFSLSQPGKYSVQLIVENMTDADTLVLHNLIEIEDPAANTVQAPILETFESSVFPPSGWRVINYDRFNPEDSITFKQFKYGGGFGQSAKCVRMNNYGYSSYGQVDVLVSPYINLQGVPNPRLSFDVAYAQLDMQNGYPLILSDTLYVFLQAGCGGWTLLWSKGGADLATDTPWADPFVNFSDSLWRKEVLDLSLFANQTIQLFFVNKFNGGNMLYLDNIRVDSLPFTALQEPVKANAVVAFPNPLRSDEALTLQLNEPTYAVISVSDIQGRTLFYEEFPTLFSTKLESKHWKSGIYILKVQTRKETYVQKIVKF